MSLQFDIQTDLYLAGRTEDGQEYHAESYYVTATDDEGYVFAHDQVFHGCRTGKDDEGWPWFEDVREEAKAGATRLLERIRAAGVDKVDGREHWTLQRASYGSKAYEDWGQHHDLHLEQTGQL